MPFSKNDSNINRNGRPVGSENKSNAELREFYQQFVSSNSGKLQELFDRVAKENPQKAIELLFKASDFILPKIKAIQIEQKRPEHEFKIVTVTDREEIEEMKRLQEE